MKPISSDLFLDRFLSYVKVDTQSSDNSETYPSTLKQLELSKMLLLELKELGLEEVEITEHGYVFGTLPATVDYKVPTIGFIAHVDTSPEVSGKDVNPQFIHNYQGGDITLKNDPSQIIEFDSGCGITKFFIAVSQIGNHYDICGVYIVCQQEIPNSFFVVVPE